MTLVIKRMSSEHMPGYTLRPRVKSRAASMAERRGCIVNPKAEEALEEGSKERRHRGQDGSREGGEGN
ncbi:hypothetical protein E2C01_044199 [Portunus trituberculatus]|uniref:Uncharacterized protein n=1 Tax=Portunus trituberculatus TaxID=210409 RepID=A0A5B7FSH7_PORTR|nr:hypothetical protein [Portunus trituberculatus]